MVDNIKEISHIKNIENLKDLIVGKFNVIVISEILSKKIFYFWIPFQEKTKLV